MPPPSAAPSPRATSRLRLVGALALAAVGGGLLVAALLWPARRAAETAPDSGSRLVARHKLPTELTEDAPGSTMTEAAARRLQDHPEELRLPPALGHTYFVVPDETNPKSDGSLAWPWSDLQAAFAHLEPGDRLVLLPGQYQGPFVVDAPARDGTAERPIEVWARVDSVLKGKGVEPVLEARRAHWRFLGLEIEPGAEASFAFATRGAGAHHIEFDDGHLHDGLHSGILIAPGSAHVTLSKNHVHIFGPIERGKTMHLEGRDARPRSVAGIVIAPGTRDITLTANNVHNILGPPILVLEPDQYAAEPGLPPLSKALRITVDKDNELQGNWAEGEPK